MITPESLASTGKEHGHQAALFCWANRYINRTFDEGDTYQAGRWRRDIANKLQLMFAIPNGGERHKAVSSNLKAEGVKAGVPDIFLPVPIWRGSIDGETGKELSEQRFHGLFIEMKKPSERAKTARGKGGVKDHQNDWHNLLSIQGYQVAVCYTWQEARDVVLDYLGIASIGFKDGSGIVCSPSSERIVGIA